MLGTRRDFLCATGVATTFPVLLGEISEAAESMGEPLHISTNTYPWLTFARRENQEFELHTDSLLADISRTGIDGYEPIIKTSVEFKELSEKLKRHGLEMRSIYVNSVLHDAARVIDSIAQVVQIAREARRLGTKIVVTNPSPIRWGGPENKTDDQLRLQARSLDALGKELRALGVVLAYHNHDAELRLGGREFHHMLTATDPENVKFCLDAHWIFRGCGDSQVALFDAVEHYHDRIVELHLRQSVDGVWSEAFSLTGDIDYSRLFKFISEQKAVPHLVLEQAVEEASPNTSRVVESHRSSVRNLRQVNLG